MSKTLKFEQINGLICKTTFINPLNFIVYLGPWINYSSSKSYKCVKLEKVTLGIDSCVLLKRFTV